MDAPYKIIRIYQNSSLICYLKSANTLIILIATSILAGKNKVLQEL
jgi:hypothetical protein